MNNMNELNKLEISLMYWHATTKMQQGNFTEALTLFGYLFNQIQSFYVGLACAYCAARVGDLEYAKNILSQITPNGHRELALYGRLSKRVAQ